MGPYRKILLVLGGADESPAFQAAREMAKRSGAELRIHLYAHHRAVNALDHASHTFAHMAQESILFQCRDWLEDAMFDLQEYGVPVSGDVYWENPDAESMIIRAVDWKPDVLIKDSGKATVLRAVLPLSVDHDLIRLCPYHLLLAHKTANAAPGRILAAVDPSHRVHVDGALNDHVLSAALAVAIQHNASLDVASVFEADTDGSQTAPEGYEEGRNEHLAALGSLLEKHGVAGEKTHIVYGRPANELVRLVVESGAQLLVIGSVCRNGLGQLIAGSVAAKLLDELDCNLLVVKPVDFDRDFLAMFGVRILHGELFPPGQFKR